jgi:hypothetical protein
MQCPTFLLDTNDVLHGAGLRPEETAAQIIEQYGRDIHPDEAAAIHRKQDAWRVRCEALLAATPGDTLVTVVDVHV